MGNIARLKVGCKGLPFYGLSTCRENRFTINLRMVYNWGQMNLNTRGEEIRTFILAQVGAHPDDIATRVSAQFGITRQAAGKHLKRLVISGELVGEGNTRQRSYRLQVLPERTFHYTISPGLEEDRAWRLDIAPSLGALPKNVLDIWQFCFTEMFNNAVDHSEGDSILVKVASTAANTEILLMDDGIGIFRKIQHAMHLLDERQAILELAKGKLTTDPERHTGQGIFFTSRLLDSFKIISGGVFYAHASESEEDWIMQPPELHTGTTVFMALSNRSKRSDRLIFSQYTSGQDFGFTKTVVPVKLAQYGEDKLISRSQAKRLLTRVDQFKSVVFDFEGVSSIGQAFADEIFRVFARSHPGIELAAVHASADVQQQVQSARSQWAAETGGL
jgi:hypothetical protein